jgi:tetratricopeptide (TPR) repeat protein
MNRNTFFLAAFSLCSIAPIPFVPLHQAWAQKDQVYTRSGSTLSGTVTATTPIQITIDVQGNPRTVQVNDIRRVMFAEDPAELNIGRGRVLAGKLDAGLQELKKLNPAQIEREIVRRDLQFYRAYCEGRLALTAGGSKKQASESMLAFVRANPNSFHFFEAAELLGDLAVSSEDHASAIRYYAAIAGKAPFPEFRMRALISQARALLAQQDFSKAEETFASVLTIDSDTAESKRQKRLATVGKARCLAETGSPREGVKIIEQIIADNDASDGVLFGRAYNALGDCLRKLGKTKDALMAYLHVDVLFYSAPEVHAESLYHLSKLWSEIGKSDRAVAARNLLDQRYPGSVWSRKE